MNFISKIIVSIILVNMIFFMFITDNILRNEQKKQLDSLNNKIMQDKKILQKINSIALYDLDIYTLNTNLKTFFNNKEIVKIKIKDEYGVSINYEDKKYDKNETIESLIYLKYNDELLGLLTVLYTKERINEQFEEFKKDVIKFFILLTLFLSFVIYFLIKQFTKPIVYLSYAADKIAMGDLDYEIKINTNDEIGNLANKFRHMQNNLKEKINSLSYKNNELNESKVHFQNLIENNVAAIIIKNDKNKISMINKKARELFKLTNSQFDGISELPFGWKIINSQSVEMDLNQIPSTRVFETKRDVFNDVIGIFPSKDEEIIWLLVNAYAEYDENREIKRIISTSIDISEIKKAETKISNLNIELEFRVRNRTKELTKSKKDLQDSINNLQLAQEQLVQNEKMASLGNLVAGVAHEINTPVGTGLTGITHLVNETNHLEKLYRSDNMSQEEFEDYLVSLKDIGKSVTISLRQAANLIKSFKQVAVDQSHNEIRKFGVKEYIDEILLSMKTRIKESNIKVNVNCPISISVNSYPGAFSQVITNLILNSLLHAYEDDEKGLITIDIEEEADEIKILYKDDGKGICKENMPKIYEPFFTTKRSEGGSGLGMYIIYNIVVSNLYGRISCESKEGDGVSFTIYMKKDLNNI